MRYKSKVQALHMTRFFSLLFVLFSLFSAGTVFAQEKAKKSTMSYQQRKAYKEFNKKKKDGDKDKPAKAKSGKSKKAKTSKNGLSMKKKGPFQRSLSIQDKKVKKRMKKNMRKSKKRKWKR